jgi:hypothetical protein
MSHVTEKPFRFHVENKSLGSDITVVNSTIKPTKYFVENRNSDAQEMIES